MIKTTLMLVALAIVTGLGAACFGLFAGGSEEPPAIEEPCAGLTGQARIDCENRKRR